MIETNIRLVYPGSNLYLWTRQIHLDGPHVTHDLVEKACGQLRWRHGLVAIPHVSNPHSLLVVARNPVPDIHLESDEWELNATDTGQPEQQITWDSPNGPSILALLVERIFLTQIETRTNLWRLDSNSIWYEHSPFIQEDGIAVYQRYEIGTMPIDNEGIGISVDVGTAFFSSENLAYFFDGGGDVDERKRREELFLRLTGRQDGQKGTLLYDNSRSKVKCYFESAPPGMTCATTGSMLVKKKHYNSLLEYYRAEYPALPVSESTPVVRVSFKGIEHPQPVAADRVYVRVMNDSIPESLKSVDKIPPEDRREIVLKRFWPLLEPDPLGKHAPQLCTGFWHPRADQILQFKIPELMFGKQRILSAPTSADAALYNDNYRHRLSMLKQAGCYRVPPNIARTIYCAFPMRLGDKPAQQLASDLTRVINGWIGKNIQIQLLPYDSVDNAIEQLKDTQASGMVIFVLNTQPRAYFQAAYQLAGWRIKRITEEVLYEHYGYLTKGIWKPKKKDYDQYAGKSRWQGFINMNALDVIQQLDVIPFRINQAGPYEAQLIIDVGRDKRHFALSLLIARPSDKSPDFHLISHVFPKTDKQREGINPVALQEAMVELLRERPRRFDPIGSLLVMRDGQVVDGEPEGFDEGIAELAKIGLISPDVCIDWVEIHKDTLKYIRMWNITDEGKIENPLIGTAILLNNNMIVMATTGSPTLHQGTAEPVLIVSDGRCKDLYGAACAHFEGSQLNWSSPNVAQKLHIGLKRTDEDLKARDTQEIRRYR